MSLAHRRLYLVAGAELATASLADLVGELAAAGVDLVQLREKELEAGDLIRSAEPVAAACADVGIPFVVNDRPDVALALGCGVHVGQNDLPVRWARRILPEPAIVGTSTHSRAEVVAAGSEPVDYFAVGPVHETPTKPGRPAVGLELLRFAAEVAEHPWFAIGGITEATLPDVIEAGARRAVVVRAITESRDPPAAARRLRDLLDSAALD